MKWYKLIFEQVQPIHVGKLNWGVVSETEIFIPGQTMWGAVVNAYLCKNKHSEIKTVQENFETITNFFPSFDEENILEPAYKDGEFAYKTKKSLITEEKFRIYFVSADFKTSINPFTVTAKEEQLYEIEYILPKPKREFLEDAKQLGFKENLYWIGLIKLKEDDIKEVFERGNFEIFVGGDARYGYGLMKLKKYKEAEEKELQKWNLNDDGKFNHDSKTPLKNFLEFSSGIKFKGDIKLIPEMDFSQNTSSVKNAKFYIAIGSMLENNPPHDLILKKGKFILES
ncbi:MULTISPECIES: RAMP superfamily CRISPR-associated protein [unclassified Desulfurobacterium]|uniref:RAMP superfamily CRISPR-associated protein n=1 Tax=unclassified Desulfurobacterium TaxID=2639089 RepID=UPI0003B52BC5|nr:MULTISPECIES: RAMP superfamily CRISPR-associated protein [unclassified Desulfurobacterium]